jgi:hypothetical protein
MANKSDLEAELSALRRDVEAMRTQAVVDREAEIDPDPDDDPSTLDRVMSQFEGTEVEKLFEKFAAELGDLQERRPLTTLFAAFLAGYLLGRAR